MKYFPKNIIKKISIKSGLITCLIKTKFDKIRILMFHGISPRSALTPEVFHRQLEYIKQHFDCCWLSEISYVIKGPLNSRPILVLTFDDGLKNNYQYVVPMLKKQNIKATFFIVPSCTNGVRPFLWNHEMLCLLMLIKNEDLPEHVGPFSTDKKRRLQETIRFVDSIKNTGVLERLGILENLRKIMPDPRHEDWMLEKFELMSEEEILNLPEIIEVGSHTLTHPILTQLNDFQAEEEIVKSSDRLRALTGRNINTFCYPNGDYTGRDVEIVKKAYKVA